MKSQRTAGLPWLGVLISLLAVLPLCGAAPAPDAESLRSNLEEEATTWLSVVRLRIEPTRTSSIGECQNLGPDDLMVTIQGEKLTGREFVDLDRKRPPTIHALVIDNSASMVDDLEYAKHAATEYVQQLRPDREKSLVMTFDESVFLVQGATRDRLAAREGIALVRSGSRTSMLDALYLSMQELDGHRERPVLILLTDGADTSSLHQIEDIEAQVTSRPDLTVFSIGLGLRTEEGVKPTRQLLRSLAQKTHGVFFDVTGGESLRKVFGRIRDTLENEAILTVQDPEPRAGASKIRVDSLRRDCQVTVLGISVQGPEASPQREPIPRPYGNPPQNYEAELRASHYSALTRAAEQSVDPGCASGRFFNLAFSRGMFGPRWFFHVGQRNASACGPDITLDHGRLYAPENEHLFVHNDTLRLTARPFEIPIPPLAELPRSPEEALDRLAAQALDLIDSEFPTESWTREGEGHARPFQDYPSLVNGMTFLGMRSVLGRAPFLFSDYREWVQGRLNEQAELELSLLADRYRRQFPDQPDAAIQTATRLSLEGQRILSVAETPSETDLQPYLAAWLGDIPAHELFLRWERLRIDRAVAGAPPTAVDRRFVDAWRELRRAFFAPSYARIVTMLIPVHDLERDSIGYWRVVLPRPGWLQARIAGLTEGHEATGEYLDLIPDLPLSWISFERMAQRAPQFVTQLRNQGYRSSDLRYELLGLPVRHGPASAFSECRVDLELRPDARAGGSGNDPFGLHLDVRLADSDEGPKPNLMAFQVAAPPGLMTPELAAELRSAARGAAESDPAALAALADATPLAPVVMEGVPWSLAASPGGAPTLSAAMAERSTVVAVEVPVHVFRNDEPVRDLRAENFEIRDRGKKRELSAFEVVDLTTLTPEERRKAGYSLPVAARRHFLFLFDFAFADSRSVHRARQALLGQIDLLHPTDLAAVAVYSVDRGPRLILGFTTDRQQLKWAVATLGSATQTEGARDPLNLTLADPDSLVAMTGMSGAPEMASGSATRAEDSLFNSHAAAIMSGMQKSAKADMRSRLNAMTRDLSALARWLNNVPGRKQVIFMSEGFDNSMVTASEDTDRLQEMNNAVESGDLWNVTSEERFGDQGVMGGLDTMLEEFRRSDCVIQTVAIAPDQGAGSRGGRGSGAEGLTMMARATGGDFHRSTNDIEQVLRDLLERTSVSYVLMFQPEDLESDGKYHKLRVKLKDAPKGARAVHRPGYYAPVPGAQRSEAEEQLTTAALLMQDGNPGELPAAVLAAPFGSASGDPTVSVLTETTGTALLTGHSGDSLPIEIYGYAIDDEGSVRGFFSEQFSLDLSKLGPVLEQTGLKFYGDIKLPPGEYTLRVLLRNIATRRHALRVVPLSVPAYGVPGPAVLMPFFPEPNGKWIIVRENEDREASTADFPFWMGPDPYLPAAAPVLRNDEERPICIVVYGFGAGSLQLDASVIGAGGSVQATLGQVEQVGGSAPGSMTLTSSLRLHDLPAGRHTLAVTVTDPVSGRSGTSTLPITVTAE